MRHHYEKFRDQHGIYYEVEDDGPFDCGRYTTYYEFISYDVKEKEFASILTENSLDMLKFKVKNHYEKIKS